MAALMLPLLAWSQDFEPHTGLWWVPDEPGSGVSIEFQDDITGNTTAFLAAYSFDEAGNPVWYVGNTVYSERRLVVELATAQDGSCLDVCTPNTPVVEPADRTITIEFFSSHAAEMRFGDSEKKQLRAFYFAAPLATAGLNDSFGSIPVPD
ncbi:MAG: hypothetical protein AAGA23_05390, partial [Pseudomonadota bacterium]